MRDRRRSLPVGKREKLEALSGLHSLHITIQNSALSPYVIYVRCTLTRLPEVATWYLPK
jgi:hypothetical protein